MKTDLVKEESRHSVVGKVAMIKRKFVANMFFQGVVVCPMASTSETITDVNFFCRKNNKKYIERASKMLAIPLEISGDSPTLCCVSELSSFVKISFVSTLSNNHKIEAN